LSQLMDIEFIKPCISYLCYFISIYWFNVFVFKFKIVISYKALLPDMDWFLPKSKQG